MTHTLIFTPSGLKATAQTDETVYDVALRAGVDIQSICGGKGLCKRCQVELEPGTHAKFGITATENSLKKLTPTEKKALHDGDMKAGRRLACRAKICGDAVIEVPSDSREVAMSIQKKGTKVETALNPRVTLHMVKLPEPTLEDNPSDGEALQEALKDLGMTTTPNLRVLQKLQPILKDHERQLIAVVRDNTDIVDVWPPSPFDLYGGAIDVGSTSIALYIYNLSTGEPVYEAVTMNPQIRFGEDLMSRVSYVMMNKGGEQRLTEAVRTAVSDMIEAGTKELGLAPNQMLDLVMVGNPIMHHLFCGINPVELGQAPFPLATKDWIDIRARDLDIPISEVARVSFFPLIGGHVGADTTAAYLTQMDRMDGKSCLLVDIGTNAEIVISHNGKVAAASSPTGPALEGAEISAGVRASKGAIERVRIDSETKRGLVKIIGHDDWLSDDMDLSEHTITGICGSGIFEVMVELANQGLINDSGLFEPERAPHRFTPEGKSWKYCLVDKPGAEIYVKQTDIRAVQLAKAALSAGVSLLMELFGCEAFDEVLLAGAFGTHLDPKYVSDIGIIPAAPAEIISTIGNAAGMGAAMALLNKDERLRIIEAVKTIEKVETATEPRFQQLFVDAMKFPTAPKASEEANAARRRSRRAARRS